MVCRPLRTDRVLAGTRQFPNRRIGLVGHVHRRARASARASRASFTLSRRSLALCLPARRGIIDGATAVQPMPRPQRRGAIANPHG